MTGFGCRIKKKILQFFLSYYNFNQKKKRRNFNNFMVDINMFFFTKMFSRWLYVGVCFVCGRNDNNNKIRNQFFLFSIWLNPYRNSSASYTHIKDPIGTMIMMMKTFEHKLKPLLRTCENIYKLCLRPTF